MNLTYIWLYGVPITVTLTVIAVMSLTKRMSAKKSISNAWTQAWHMSIWLCLLAHYGVRAVLLLQEPRSVLGPIALELTVALSLAGVWTLVNKSLLRPQTTEFEDAKLLMTWIHMSEKIVPKKLIPLLKVGPQIFPHTRGCDMPSLCLSQELLDSLSENGKRYLFAHYLFYFREGHNRYKRLLNFGIIVLWYNPLMQIIGFMMSRDFNQICDNLSLEYFGRSHAGNYGMTLIHAFDTHGPRNPLLSRVYRELSTKHLKWRIEQLS